MSTESDITPSAADRHHPLLKLALELGPLMIFFFANLRGQWLVETFPALSELGGPLFVATGLFMAATIISLIVSKIVLGHLPIMPLYPASWSSSSARCRSGCRTKPSSR